MKSGSVKKTSGRKRCWPGPCARLIFPIAQKMSQPQTFSHAIESLEKKQETVLELTAASTAASVAITLLPGDAATPIADKLADLSGYFLIVLCAIFLEKYLLTIMAGAAFRVLLPLACVLLAASLFFYRDTLRMIAKAGALRPRRRAHHPDERLGLRHHRGHLPRVHRRDHRIRQADDRRHR